VPRPGLRQDGGAALAKVAHAENCIGCLTCAYACPSQCIDVGDYLRLRPFHRMEKHAALVRRFLQEQPVSQTVTDADIDEAWSDVSARLFALSDTIVETIGKGYRAVARRAGTMAAEHLPEMYEAHSLDEVLAALRGRFANAFDFDYEVNGRSASLTFKPCGLCRVVEGAGQTVGEADLCQMFHEHWVGLLSSFVGVRYRCQVPEVGKVCRMELEPVEGS
jgi:ferredoxin